MHVRLIVVSFTTDAMGDPSYGLLSKVFSAEFLISRTVLALSIARSDKRGSLSGSCCMLYSVWLTRQLRQRLSKLGLTRLRDTSGFDARVIYPKGTATCEIV